MARKTNKEEKEQEFLDAVEMVVGFYLPEWQKDHLRYIRTQSLAGNQIDLTLLKKPPTVR